MAKVTRVHDFENGKRTDAEQVDEEFDNLLKGINDLDDELQQKVDIEGDFKGTWNGIPFRDADPGMAGRLAEVELKVKEEEKATVTLVRGENTIAVPENAALAPVEILGDEVKNLLPLFDSGVWSIEGTPTSVILNSPNKITLTATGNYQGYKTSLSIDPSKKYKFASKTSVTTLCGRFTYKTSGGAEISRVYPKATNGTAVLELTPPSNAVSIEICIYNELSGSGTYVFEDTILVEGTVEREFVAGYQPVRNPYLEVDNDSYLYFDEYLFKGEKLYQTPNGEWRKKQNKIESLLTPKNVINPRINTSYTGGKGMLIPVSEALPGVDVSSADVINFNGVFLTRTDSPSNITNDRFYLYGDNFILFLSSAVTGWGDGYTPTASELLAFILGWKMNNGTFGTNYNGTGTKTWIPRGDVNNTRATTATPTVLASDAKYIKVIYKTNTEQDVPAKYEGSLRLVKGTNKVTLGEGVVLREKISSKEAGGTYYTNGTDNKTEYKYRLDRYIDIHKNAKVDTPLWTIYSSGTAYGSQKASISKQLYDPLATYTATYKVLDRYAFSCYVGSVQAKHTTNFRNETIEQVKSIEEIKKKLSQLGIVVIDRLGKKDGIALLDKDGIPLKADGTTSKIKRELITWKDTTTLLPKNNGTYTKKITIPYEKIFDIILYLNNPNDNTNDSKVYRWNDEILAKNSNAPMQLMSNGSPLTQPFNARYPFNTVFAGYSNAPWYGVTPSYNNGIVEYWNYSENVLELRWRNPSTSADGWLQADVRIEVLYQ